jgi:hypothetical protein
MTTPYPVARLNDFFSMLHGLVRAGMISISEGRNILAKYFSRST